MSQKKLHTLRREYGARACDAHTLNACPITQFRLWLKEAIENASIDPTAMVLSTVAADLTPDARVVLLKEVDPTGFIFYTHALSTKGRQLQSHPTCALTFYWPTLSRQVRVRGKVDLLDAASSKQYFESRPYLSQLSSLISPQSEVIQNRHWLDETFQMAKDKYPEGQVPLPEDWQGYLVVPFTIEFWQGRDNRLHDRVLYTKRETAWVKERLAP